MTDPSLLLQTAIRAALLGTPAIMALVQPQDVRAGSTRPGASPTIILGAPRVGFLGRAAGGQLCARVILTLHLWAHEDGADTARGLGGHVLAALLDPPQLADGAAVDEWARPELAWSRDPDPAQAWTHGLLELEGVVRWRA